MNASHIVLAFISGILPALLWLWFWLREDNLHPEPRSRIAKTFMAGVFSVVIVLPLQMFIANKTNNGSSEQYLMWAFFEKFMKFDESKAADVPMIIAEFRVENILIGKKLV